MADISRAVMFGKLDTLSFRAMESATTFCRLRGNPYVEFVHWLHQLLQLPDSDLHRVIRHFDVETAVLARDLTDALDRLPRGSTSITDISSQLEEAVERGWVYGSLLFDAQKVRSAHVLIGALQDARVAQRAARHLARIRSCEARRTRRRFRHACSTVRPEAAAGARRDASRWTRHPARRTRCSASRST